MLQASVSDRRVANLLILHYVTAALFFTTDCCLVFLFRKSFAGHYFSPGLLAITHITTLGWISTIILGSLYQIAPVIMNSPLFSIKIALVTYVLLVSGTVLLAISFALFSVGYLIQLSAILLFLAISLFLLNMYLTAVRSKTKSVESDFIITSVFWFWLTCALGASLAFNFQYMILPKEHVYYLKIHAHVGVLGWVCCLIIGVASKLVPMFLISGKLNTKLLIGSYYLLNGGLLGFAVDSFFFNGMERAGIYGIFILAGIFLFLLFMLEAYKKRLKKKLDIGLKYTFLSFISIAIPVGLWGLIQLHLLTDPKLVAQTSTAMMFCILFGFFTLLLFGQVLKNLSYIIWLKKYQDHSGNGGKPLPRDLYSSRLAAIQLYVYAGGFFTVLYGILYSSVSCICAGSIPMIAASLLHTGNVLRILFYKPVNR